MGPPENPLHFAAARRSPNKTLGTLRPCYRFPGGAGPGPPDWLPTNSAGGGSQKVSRWRWEAAGKQAMNPRTEQMKP